MIENLYLNIGNVKVKQNISIPIGIDHTSFWQMFFLYSYEEEYMPLLICSDKVVVRNLHSAKSLIDYISVKNDGGEFGRSVYDIYSKELETSM